MSGTSPSQGSNKDHPHSDTGIDIDNQTSLPRPDDYDSDLEDWADPRRAKLSSPKPSIRKKIRIVIEESEAEDELPDGNPDAPTPDDSEKTESMGDASSEDPSEDEPDSEDMFSSPESSPNSYTPTPLGSHDLDMDWSKYEKMPLKRDTERIRKL